MLTRVNISQNNVTVYREAVPTNQTQKSLFIQSKNKKTMRQNSCYTVVSGAPSSSLVTTLTYTRLT